MTQDRRPRPAGVGRGAKKIDFPTFQPWLEKTLDLKRQEAECVGYTTGDPYDALLDEYEPRETADEPAATCSTSLRGPLVELVGRIAQSPQEGAGRDPRAPLPRRRAGGASPRGADSASASTSTPAGSTSAVHPFCTGLGPGDTRMTTRYDEHYFGDAFFGVLHETGHGLYDQGLPDEHFGTPRGEAVSLGIHESQSRLWENLVGRSRSFWQFFLPKAQAAFPRRARGRDATTSGTSPINDVRPCFIRTEADEATYNLHIMLRFELEQAMLTRRPERRRRARARGTSG